MTTATQLDTENGDAARDHEVKVQAIIKTLTVQRDSANNAIVNAMAEKAVVETKLNFETESRVRFQQGYNNANQALSEMRILVANLQTQLQDAHMLIAEKDSQLAALQASPVSGEIIKLSTEVEECPDCSDCPKDCSNRAIFVGTPS